MSFLVLWFICLSSSLVYFKNGPVYLKMRTAMVFIPLMRFLLCTLISSNFLVLLRYCFFFFSFFFSILLGGAHFQSTCKFPFFWAFWYFLYLIVVFLAFCHFPPFIISMTHFSMPNSLNILTACIMVSDCFSFLQNVWCCPCTLGSWFFLRFMKFVFACSFPLYEVHTVSFQNFFVWEHFLIVHTWKSSPLRSNLLRLQCTCCTVSTTSGRPHESLLVWACQWLSSPPLSSPQLSNNDSLRA